MLSIRVLLFFISLQAVASEPPKPERLTIGHIQHPNIHSYISFIRQSYADIGIKTSFEPSPITRRLLSANEGLIDAVVASIKSNTAQYPNLLPITPSIGRVELGLICIRTKQCDVSLLSNSSLTFHASRGEIRILEGELGLSAPQNVIFIENLQQLIEMVAKGRIDYLIQGISVNGEKIGFFNRHKTAVIGEYHLYHFINMKHKAIAEPLSKAFRKNMPMLKNMSQDSTSPEVSDN